MIDIEKAKKEMEKYILTFDQDNPKIANKKRHTFSVLNISIQLSKDLKLDEENTKLAEIIALLHDIGRFEQLKKYDSCMDYKTIDHGDLGVEILSKNDFIRNFIEDDKYDDIIFKAIKNHNKFKIEEGLNKIELLHCQIIRDCDKLDNYYKEARIEHIITKNEKISDKIYNDYKEEKSLNKQDIENEIDYILLCCAWIFDYNFKESYKIIKRDNLINRLFDQIKESNEETKNKLEELRKISHEYVDKKILS